MMTVPKYHRPNTIAEAVEIKVRHGAGARYWAGGTDLYLLMDRKALEIEHCIDLSAVDALLSGSARSEIGPSFLGRVGEATSAAALPISDIRGSEWYRRHQCGVLAQRAAAKEDLIEHPEFQRLSRHVMVNMRQEYSASIMENLI